MRRAGRRRGEVRRSYQYKARIPMSIDYVKEGRTAIFTINRPEARNALDVLANKEFSEAMTDFRDDPDLWVGIVTGAGDKVFLFRGGSQRHTALPEASLGAGILTPHSLARARDLEASHRCH